MHIIHHFSCQPRFVRFNLSAIHLHRPNPEYVLTQKIQHICYTKQAWLAFRCEASCDSPHLWKSLLTHHLQLSNTTLRSEWRILKPIMTIKLGPLFINALGNKLPAASHSTAGSILPGGGTLDREANSRGQSSLHPSLLPRRYCGMMPCSCISLVSRAVRHSTRCSGPRLRQEAPQLWSHVQSSAVMPYCSITSCRAVQARFASIAAVSKLPTNKNFSYINAH